MHYLWCDHELLASMNYLQYLWMWKDYPMTMKYCQMLVKCDELVGLRNFVRRATLPVCFYMWTRWGLREAKRTVKFNKRSELRLTFSTSFIQTRKWALCLEPSSYFRLGLAWSYTPLASTTRCQWGVQVWGTIWWGMCARIISSLSLSLSLYLPWSHVEMKGVELWSDV